MIIKIQQSIITNAEKPQMLVYSKSKIFTYQADLTKEVKALLKDRPKAYFKAKIINHVINLLDEVEQQDF